MKVVSVIDKSKDSKAAETLKSLQGFRAISLLEGNETSSEHSKMLEDLAFGKISRDDYIKARMSMKFA